MTLSGSSFTGMWTEFYAQGGPLLASGYTPHTFTGTQGDTYVVAMSNWSNYVFCHWQDGNTNPNRSVTPTGISLALTAYYSTTGSCPPQKVQVTVNSYSITTGSPFTGMWLTVEDSSGNVIDSGYTGLTFTATVGSTYTITVSDWENYVFQYWGDTGSSNATLTISPSQATTLTAYYDTPG